MSYLYNMPVSATIPNAKTGKKERQTVGAVPVTLFTLEDLGIEGEYKKVTKAATTEATATEEVESVEGVEGENEGAENVEKESAEGAIQLVYTDKALNHVFKALVSHTLATARNKLIKGSINVKEGYAIATTVAELIAPPITRTNTYAVTSKAFATGFSAFMDTTGKSAGVCIILSNYATMQGRSSLKNAIQEHKSAMSKYLSLYAETLTIEALEDFRAQFEAVTAAIKFTVTVSAEDFA